MTPPSGSKRGRRPAATSVLAQHNLDLAVSDAGRRYDIFDEIGRGGAARVCVALDRDLNRRVAVKILRPQLNDSRDAVARFLNEAQIMAKLDHPGVVPIYEIGILDDTDLFFAMELVDGRTLRELLDELAAGKGEFSLSRLLRTFEQVCQVAAFAHSRCVVHRDLKPENIMIGEYNEVYVMDWGIARDLDEARPDLPICRQTPGGNEADATALAALDNVKGTPAYMSPEQVLGMIHRVDFRSDVFSLGVILYELLAGRHPFRGQEVRDTLNAIKSNEPPPLNPPFGFREFSSIAAKALKKVPDERYQTAEELADDVRRALEHRPVSAHRDSLPNHYLKFARRHRALTVLGVGSFAALFWILVSSLLTNRDLTRMQEAAAQHMASARHYEERLLTLESRQSQANAGIKREMQLLVAELRGREAAQLAAARTLLTAVYQRRRAELPAAARTKLRSLWIDELEAELRHGNRTGTLATWKQISRMLEDATLGWTAGERQRLERCRREIAAWTPPR